VTFLKTAVRYLTIIAAAAIVSTTQSCVPDQLSEINESLPKVLQDIRDAQECCYLDYKVKEKVEGYSNKISRNAAVKIHVRQMGGVYRGTGTYFKYRGRTIVITAAHIWAESPALILKSEAMITSPSEKVIGKVVYWDPYADIAILLVPEIGSRTAVRFVRDPEYVVGEPVVYSGFPGRNSLLTFSGQLAGDGYGTSLAMHSMAWGGSSGSGVFDRHGRFVGVVSSIMVGNSFLGPKLVGSIVYVSPANLIDMQYLRQNLRKLESEKNDGF
jgi:hypothetical protein